MAKKKSTGKTTQQKQTRKDQGIQNFLEGAIGVVALFLLVVAFQYYDEPRSQSEPTFDTDLPPLVMEGGDPYIRALMRTISASEANDPRPYSILYGGKHVSDLSQHPNRCIRILRGPNLGKCSTAAGRYQMINTTWYSMARRYHPKTSNFLWKTREYSFEPVFQDRVVHDWLSDPKAWNADLSQLLRQGELDRVLRRLSSTWTSLGYGIETNSMTRHLPKIYHEALQEELKKPG